MLSDAVRTRTGGVQLGVTLTAGGRDRVDAAVGQQIRFDVTITADPGTGQVTDVSWSRTGHAPFAAIDAGADGRLQQVVTYDSPGTRRCASPPTVTGGPTPAPGVCRTWRGRG